MMGIAHDNAKPYKRTTECHECGEKFKRGESKQILKIYDDPWALQPRVIAVHDQNDDDRLHLSCLDKMSDTSWADFRYFLCDHCNRLIIRQCPDNGWRSYVHQTDAGEEICVKCYQDNVLKNGHTIFDMQAGNIPGDFFSGQDIASYNWKLVPGMNRCHITGRDSVRQFTDRAISLIKAGNKVLVDYDALGIGGSEGYVTLYYKPANAATCINQAEEG